MRLFPAFSEPLQILRDAIYHKQQFPALDVHRPKVFHKFSLKIE